MGRSAFAFSACLLISVIAHAAEHPAVGEKAPNSIVGTFVKGGWSAEQHNVCPVLAHRGDQKIAVFAKSASDNVLGLTEALDAVVANDESLKWSFLFVSHENSPTPTQEDWDKELARLAELTSRHKLSHMAVGQMIRIPDSTKSTRARPQVGEFQDGDVVVMLIRPQSGTFGTIAEVAVVHAEQLDSPAIERIANQMVTAAQKK